MGFRQIFRGSTLPKFFTHRVPSNIWGPYSLKIFHGWGSVKYLGALQPQKILRMGFRQILGVPTAPKSFPDGVPSNIWGVYSPQKYLTDVVPPNIWGSYSPKIFHGWGYVKYLGGLQPQNISRMGFRQIFEGSTPPKYFTDGVPSNIWGVYTPKIFHKWGSVKYLGGLHPQNVSRKAFRQIFGGSTAPKCSTDGVPSNIWGVNTPKIIHGRGSVEYLGGLQPPNI